MLNLRSFVKSELERIHSQLPLMDLATDYTNCTQKSKRGTKFFSPEREIALMFLKTQQRSVLRRSDRDAQWKHYS